MMSIQMHVNITICYPGLSYARLNMNVNVCTCVCLCVLVCACVCMCMHVCASQSRARLRLARARLRLELKLGKLPNTIHLVKIQQTITEHENIAKTFSMCSRFENHIKVCNLTFQNVVDVSANSPILQIPPKDRQRKCSQIAVMVFIF